MPTSSATNGTRSPRRSIGAFGLVVVMVLALFAAAFHDRNPLSERAASYATQVMQASGGAYVTLRALNAALSTAQEVEVSGGFIVEGSGQPFRWLEPVDDTIERIAGIVFAVMLGSGIVAFAVGPIGAIGAGMLAAGAALLLIERMVNTRRAMAPLTGRLVWYGGFLLIALPLAFVLSSSLADPLTAGALSRHQAVIEEIVAGMGEVDDAAGADEGMAERLKRIMSETGQYSEIWGRADELIRAYIGVLSVYIFRILILPVLLVVGLFFACRSFAQRA